MFHRPIRLAALALLVFTLEGCKGGGEPTAPAPTPTPTAAIALGSATASITAGGTLAVPVTITRGGGFTGDVTVTATGLPTGVTAGSTTIASGSTSGTLTLTALASAPAAAATPISITASGTGVTIAAQPLALTVVGGNGAVIALSANAGSIEAGRAGSIIVTVTRTGTFAGTVNIAVTGLPTGVSAVNQSLAAGVTTDTIPLTTNLGAAAGTSTLTITGTGSGITIAPQTYALTTTLGPIAQLGNDMTSPDGQYAATMALNADGTRLVVGAATTANGTTRVYERTGNTWTQMGADIIGEASGDRAGTGVSINAAGTRIAIGAYLNDGTASAAGHVRVYDFVGGSWTQTGADIDGGEGSSWGFGWRVALSASGSRLAVSAAGVGSTTGRVKVYDLTAGTWTQVGTTLTAGNEFGDALDISSDGTTIAVSSPSAAGTSRAGTAQVFRLVGSTWTQLGNLLQGTQINDGFGSGLALTATGSRIVVAAPGDREGGVSGGGGAAGKLRIFDLVGATWTQVGADILGAVELNGEALGETLGISDDGTRVAANGAGQSVAKVYTFAAGAWTQTGPTITSYGTAVRAEGLALSADGRALGVGYINGSPRIARVFRITP
jgi:hypothetical protein